MNKQDNLEDLVKVSCRQFKNGVWRDIEDWVGPEASVSIFWPGSSPVRLWAFPRELEDLAVGHALLDLCPEGSVPVLESREENRFYLSPEPASEGKTSGDAEISLAAADILEALEGLMSGSGKWEATGSFHRAGIFDPGGMKIIREAEDIGRHNCLDRLAGWALKNQVALGDKVLLVSARATGSLTRKARRAGFPVLISRSAVTTAAIRYAEQTEMTLAGFARGTRLTVFSDLKQRVAQ